MTTTYADIEIIISIRINLENKYSNLDNAIKNKLIKKSKEKYIPELLGKILETDEKNIDIGIRIGNVINNTCSTAAVKIINKANNIEKRYFTFSILENNDIVMKHCCNKKDIQYIDRTLKNILLKSSASILKINVINSYILPQTYIPLIELEEKLPYGLTIATITLIFKTEATFNFLNIGKHITIEKYKNIENTTYKINNVNYFRTKLKHPKKEKKAFYNQVSLRVRVNSKRNPLNIKLFRKNNKNNQTKHSSVQLTGYTKLSDLIEIITILNKLFQEEKYLFVDGVPRLISFIDNVDKFSPISISDIQICMVNTNYKFGFMINRSKLFELLYNHKDTGSGKIYLSFEKNNHSSIDIKYEIKNRKDPKSKYVSIFIFETGSVIITGVKSVSELTEAYSFIIFFVTNHFRQLVKIPIDP